MKFLPLLLSCLLLSACSITPGANVTSVATPTSKISSAMDTIASAIRHAEDAAMTPAAFNHFAETYVALVPYANAYIKDAELAYYVLYLSGNVGAGALERLAARYDTK